MTVLILLAWSLASAAPVEADLVLRRGTIYAANGKTVRNGRHLGSAAP